MLDKLGQNLSEALNKIKNATFVDKKLVKEVIKDIQKALIQSDRITSYNVCYTKLLRLHTGWPTRGYCG